MAKKKEQFVEGAKLQGYSRKVAEGIFEMLVPFAGYGFNKSHAAAYSVLAYHTAYLKANYPAEFMAANLTNEIARHRQAGRVHPGGREMGLEILPPDINLSERDFSVAEGQDRLRPDGHQERGGPGGGGDRGRARPRRARTPTCSSSWSGWT